MTETGTVLCRTVDLKDPDSMGFVLETRDGPAECFLVRRGDCVRAYLNSCPHTGAPMEWVPNQFLDVHGELIQCALHGALFRIETGECLRGPCVGDFLQPVGVAIHGGQVLVDTGNGVGGIKVPDWAAPCGSPRYPR